MRHSMIYSLTGRSAPTGMLSQSLSALDRVASALCSRSIASLNLPLLNMLKENMTKCQGCKRNPFLVCPARVIMLTSLSYSPLPCLLQDSWGPSTAPLQGGPTPPQSQASLPAGAQATPVAANPQPAPQLPLPASLAPQPGLPAAQVSCTAVSDA